MIDGCMPIVSRFVELAPLHGDEGARIPITTITGRQGPVLALVAGNHGYEYPPILASQKLRGELAARAEAGELSGTVILVHVANMPSFLGRTVYFSPVDGKNLNRCYPGRADGTISERIAHAITTEAIVPADFLLDLHCGDGNESLRPYVYQTVTSDEKLNRAIERMTLAFGIDHIVVDRNRPADPERSVYCSNTAITRGKPAVTIESGYLGSTDAECVDQIARGCLGVMRELGMLPDGPPPLDAPVYLDPVEVLSSPATGLLYPQVERDQQVAEGQPLARITDFFGEEIAVVRAPFAGVVLYVVATPPIKEGQPVACVGAPRRV
jgi:predicted deacylase